MAKRSYGMGHVDKDEEWITAKEFAREYNVARSTAYDAFKRLHTIRIGSCIRARRSEIEQKLAKYGHV